MRWGRLRASSLPATTGPLPSGLPGYSLLLARRSHSSHAGMAALSPALDEAVSELRYGTIALNAWIGVDYLTATATASWDTFPRHTPDDVESGIGVVHNALLLDEPERTVARSPFHPAHQALLHGVQLDRAGTLGTDAARPSLPVPKRQHPPHPEARLCSRRPAGRARLRANSSPTRQGGVGAWPRPRGSQLSLWPGSHLVPASSGPEAPHGVDFPTRRQPWTRHSSQRVGEAP